MIKKGHGKIINICSMMSELGRETVTAYAAAKGALRYLPKTLHRNMGNLIFSVTGYIANRAFERKTAGWFKASV
jgi:gluconate 5-dehydrogenase